MVGNNRREESIETEEIRHSELFHGKPSGRTEKDGASPFQNEPTELTRVGEFNVLGEIGRGAMGVVYHAERSSDGQEVALKLVTPRSLASADHRKMFVREMNILRVLNHKRIVRFIDSDIAHGQLYIAMEFVKQSFFEDIMSRQSRGKQVRLACGIIDYVLEALQYAHEQSVVHRDIKPGNILTFMDGDRLKAKVADFGLAKYYDSAGLSTISNDNGTKGTLAFMAPEQIRNARYARPACDIYAAAACLFYYLTGRTPHSEFEGGNLDELLNAKLTQPAADIRSIDDEVPESLASIIHKALSIDAEQRFQSANEMRAALDRFAR